MPKIFVYGDSHTRAIKVGAARFPKDVEFETEFAIHWLLTEKNGVSRGDLAFKDAKSVVATLQPGDIFVISLLGNAHNIFGLLKHEHPICVLDMQSHENISPGFELIPSNTMQDLFYSFCESNKRVVELKNQSTVPVFHLMTPPPKEDSEYIISKISQSRNTVIGVHDLNSPNVRLALWKLEMSALNRFCKKIGIMLIPPPSEAISVQGFLKPEFYGGDATHANRGYGELVLQQLKQLVIPPQ